MKKYANVLMCQCANEKECANVLICQCANEKICQCANEKMKKCANEWIQNLRIGTLDWGALANWQISTLAN